MPANSWRWGAGLLSVLVVGGAAGWMLNERRWSGPLYCIEKPGTLWNGLAPLPPGFAAECPESTSYRQEIRSGLSRVERYRVAGWQPKALLEVLKQGGYRQTTDEPIAPGNYAAFLTSGGNTLQYLASLQEGQTVVTLSGRP